MMSLMYESFKKKGMKMNVSKMKVMVLQKDDEMTECNIEIGSGKIERVKEFKYLGCMCIDDADIESRVKAENLMNGALHSFVSHQNVSKNARLVVHKGVLMPTLMDGSER